MAWFDRVEEFAGHSGKGEEPVITPVLCTSGASEQAVKVYDFLRENRNKKTLSGTMACPSWNVNEAEWVYQHTGKYPAIAFFDYLSLEYSPCSWIELLENENSGRLVEQERACGCGLALESAMCPRKCRTALYSGGRFCRSGYGKRATTVFSAANATKEALGKTKSSRPI